MYSILLSLVIFEISRIIFFIFNWIAFSHFGFVQISKALFSGILFDCVYIFYAFSPFIIFHLLPFNFKIKQSAQWCAKIYFLVIIGVGILLNLIDSAYFNYSHKRTGKELFYMLTDSANPIGSYFLNYWYLLAILVLLLFIAGKWYPKIQNQKLEKFTYRDIPHLFFMILISILGMRGSVGLKPLRSVDASKFVESGLEALALNTPFQIISSLESDKPVNPFQTQITSNLSDNSYIKNYKHKKIVNGKKNIVLVILESFGRNRIGFMTETPNQSISVTPFIDSFSKSCLVFPNCYANGTKSIDAVPALFASLPSLLQQPFIYSWYQANIIRGIQYYLNKEGYNCSFYHGAANGTMGFESFLKKAGAIEYFGINQFTGNKEKEYDGNWGIYDHYYLHYFNQELAHKHQPYFSTVFTLSSHPPYKIPKEIELSLPGISNPMLKSIAYTDYSLKLFFSERAKSPDNENTIYILIGDHTANADNDYFYSSKGQMELFCMIYDPSGEIKPGINNRIIQQLDIMPSILNLCNYPDSFFSLGNSIFDDSTKGMAFFEMYGSYHIIEEEHMLSISSLNEKKFRFFPKQYYKLDIPFSEKSYLENDLNNNLKHLIWTFFNRLEQNKFY